MTPYERENPSCLNSSRKRRIAAGSGVKVEEINRLLKQFDMMNNLIKQFRRSQENEKAAAYGRRFPGYARYVSSHRGPHDEINLKKIR